MGIGCQLEVVSRLLGVWGYEASTLPTNVSPVSSKLIWEGHWLTIANLLCSQTMVKYTCMHTYSHAYVWGDGGQAVSLQAW